MQNVNTYTHKGCGVCMVSCPVTIERMWIQFRACNEDLSHSNHHIGHFVLYREVVLSSEVKMYQCNREGTSLSFIERFFYRRFYSIATRAALEAVLVF